MDRTEQDALYEEARSCWGAALQRLARGYELDPERRRDLVQEMHIQLWRSLASFDRRCSLRTWVYRVSNNVGATHIIQQRRAARLVDLESLEPDMISAMNQTDAQYCAGQLLELIHRLKPIDRQIMLLYLEGETAGAIAEVGGLSSSNVATKIHRIKKLLKQQYLEGINAGE